MNNDEKLLVGAQAIGILSALVKGNVLSKKDHPVTRKQAWALVKQWDAAHGRGTVEPAGPAT